MDQPLIIAHRGASFLAPENTLSAVKLAWEIGAQAVEIDVRKTWDNQIVAIHNATTRHMTGHSKFIRLNTLKQLKKLDFGILKDAKWKGERIPTLDSILNTIPEKGRLYIEIKSTKAILPLIKNLLKSYSFRAEQINFLAFNYKIAVKTKKMFQENLVYFLYEHRRAQPSAEYFLSRIKTAGLDGLDISVHPSINKDFVNTIKDAGKKLIVWTVNDPAQAQRLIEAGIDGITTDRPAWLKEQLIKMNTGQISGQ